MKYIPGEMAKQVIRGDETYYGPDFVALADSHDDLQEALTALIKHVEANYSSDAMRPLYAARKLITQLTKG